MCDGETIQARDAVPVDLDVLETRASLNKRRLDRREISLRCIVYARFIQPRLNDRTDLLQELLYNCSNNTNRGRLTAGDRQP